MDYSTTIDCAVDENSTRRQIEGQSRLLDALLPLASAVDLASISTILVEEGARLLECERGVFHHYDRKHHELHAMLGGENEQVREFRRPANHGIRGDIANRRALARLLDPSSHPQWCGELDRLTGFTTRNMLVAPLISPGDASLYGVLELLNKQDGEFDAIDESLLQTFIKHAELAIDRARFVQEIRDQHELDSSLGAAREIQRRFMPSRMPEIPGYEVSTWWLPNQTVGGDYCDVIPLAAGKLGLCVADVSGHGLGPSLLMASVRAALHALVLEHSSPQVLMEMVGRSLTNDLNATGFITMVLASLDYQAHRVVFSNAGHAPALHYAAKTRSFSPLEATGTPLGVVDYPQLPLGPPVEMHSGDWLILCTDGIVEAMDPGEVQFGYERLQQIIEQNSNATAHDLVRIIGSQVEQHYTEEHPQDDLTILALRRNG